MRCIESSELTSRVGEVVDMAGREPVRIKRPAGGDLVLLSAVVYERLNGAGASATHAVRAADLPDETLVAMAVADTAHLPLD